MEILEMTFAGIPVSLWLIIAGVWFGGRAAWKEWREHRDLVKEMDDASKKFNEEHEWEPHLVNGVDCGRWVEKKDRLPP